MNTESAVWRACARLLVLALLPIAFAQAQTAAVSPDPVAGDALLGEQYCFDAPWTNAGPPGYGPYLRVVLPPELDFNSASLFGTGLSVVSNSVFPASGTLPDPLFLPAPGTVTGTQGWRLLILEYPVGSVVAGGPDMSASICVTPRNAPPNLAAVGTPYPIQLTPIYRYGDTATGVNGSRVGAPVSPTVTPQVLLLEKTNTTPEDERPPGPQWQYDYVLRVDIANGALINPLTISDTLPANVQFVGPVTVTGGVGCAVTTTPSTTIPGGDVLVSCTGNTLGGPGDSDVVVRFPVYITDILDETACDTRLLTNTGRANGTYLPAGGSPIALPEITDISQVTAKHVAVQKGADVGQAVPDDTVSYTLNLQTTEFGTTSALSVHDVLPDGVTFDIGSATIAFNGGGANGITPVYTPGINDDLVFDVVTAYGGTIPPGTAIRITYTAHVLQLYKAGSPPHAPVLAADPLTNTAMATFSLVEGAAACTDDTAATVVINPVEIHKELLSIGPFVPGDYVTFRLSMTIPSGDTQDVVFTDYFPLPVFDVTDINLSYGGTDIFRAVSPPAANADTMNLIPTVSINAATNALILTYPNINTTSPQTVAVDVRVRVQPNAFADGLFLTNIFRATSNNSANEAAVGEAPVQIQVRAPKLDMTKGVLSTNGTGTISPAPSTLPVNGNLTGADAGDQVVYRLTIENQGGAPAFDVVVNDTVPTGLTACAVTNTQLGNGGALTSSGDLFTAPGLTLIRGGDVANAVLDANDGSIGAPYGADTAFVDVTCTVAANVLPGSSIINTASASWKPQPVGTPGVQTFPPVQDDATVGIRQVALVKSIAATSEAASTTPNVLIGEVVRYRLQVAVPEGVIPAVVVVDALPAGMQYLGNARIALVSNGGLTSSVVSGAGVGNVIPTAPMTSAGVAITATGGPFVDGTDPRFDLGNVSNIDNDADIEYIVIEFNALVRNAGNAGTTRANTFGLQSDGTNFGPQSNNVGVTIRLPNVTVAKSVSPSSGVEAGDTVTYTLVISNAAGANVMPAYDVAVNDVLPAQLDLLGIVSSTPAGGASAFTGTATGNTISGTIDVIPAGGSVTITYNATVLVAAAPGTSIINAVTAGWSSLPGANGTTPNPTGSNAPGAPGANDGERTFTGNANAPIGVTPVTLGKAVVDTSLPYTGDGAVRPGIADLAIGETATFHITATIPEGTAPQLVITDTVPYTNGVMEVVSGRVVSTGSGMTIATLNPVPIISDAQLGDGFDDTISFDFGQVINPVGNNTPTPQTIVVEVVARLLDLPANTNNDQLTNHATVQFGGGSDGTATAGVDVVEPLLDIQKSGDITTGQAGDTVNFSVVVRHLPGSNMEARALTITDTLPSPNGLSLNLASVTATVDAGCATPPTLTDASAANTVTVTADNLPIGCELTISYSATLQNDVIVNTDVINTANLAWFSITPGDPAGPGREYDDSDDHTIRVSSPGMTKEVVSVSPDIGADEVDGSLPDVTIGGVVTFQFDVELPAGDSLTAVVTDQLPTNTVSMRVESSRIVAVGAGITGINATTTPTIGTPGAATDGPDPDTYADLVTWTLGDLNAAPVAAADRTIRFEVVARVMDTAQTQGGVTVRNTASFTASTIPTPISASADVDIVEPLLTLAKGITQINGAAPDPARIVQAGDTVAFEITIAHQAPGSSADAFNIVVSDVLPNPGLAFAGNVAGSCGATPDDTGYPTVTFSFANLTLASGSCTITYEATVTNDVNPGSTYANLAQATYDSLADPTEDGVRHGTTNTGTDQITILGPSLVKVVTTSSLGGTGNAQHDPALEDLAIGENVTYTLTIGFPQGATTNAVLIDTLPAGLEAIGANVGNFGNTGITTSLPGTPVLTDSGIGYNDTVTFNFGTISNPANGVLSDDWIQVSVTARVKDVPANVDALVLTNTATFSNDTSPAVNDSADVELVEPVVGLTKSMTAGTGGSATIALVITNTGTGPAYDIVLEDVLSHAVWLDSSIALGTTPTGYTGALDTGTPGQTTVRFTSNTGVGLLPGASVTATFTASLATFPPTPNPVLNSAEIPTHGSAPVDPANPDVRDYDPVDDDAQLGFPDPVVEKTVANTGTGAGGTFVPGDLVTFHVAITNNGPVALNNITLTDIVPANTTFAAAASDASWAGTGCVDGAAAGTVCTLGTFSVAAAATETIAFSVRINSPLPAGVEQVANQALLSSPDLPDDVPSDDPGTPADPDDPTIVPISAAPDMTLTKVHNLAAGETASPGDVLIYTLTYQNVGTQNATGVTITETVPPNTTFYATSSTAGWSCPNGSVANTTCVLTIGNVAAGAAPASVQFAVRIVDPVSAGATRIENTATVADDGTNGPDPTPGNNSDSETSPLDATPGLHLTKSDGGATSQPGGIVVYTLRFWNDGDANVANASLIETVPAHTVFVPGSSSPGWGCVPDNNAGSTCTLSVGTLIGHTPQANARTATFAVQINNPLPAGVEHVANSAVLTQPDPTIPDVPADDTTPVVAAPDLAISKVPGAAIVSAGDVLVYTLSYQNIGNQDATGVVITEIVPANTSFNAAGSSAGWSCGDGAPAGSACSFNVAGVVAAGAPSVNVTFAINIPSPVPAGMEQVINAVSITDDGSNGPDPNPGNNNDEVTTPVDAMPQLRVTKSDGGITVAPGDTILYTITYQNTGDQDATGVVLTETVPLHTTYSGAGWSCVPNAPAGSVCSFAVPGTVAAGAPAASVSFQVTVDDPIGAGVENIANHVTIHSDGDGGEPSTPPDPSDPTDPRQDDETTPVDAVPDMAIVKSSTSDAVAGGVVVYNLSYANLGNQGATGVVITETVPANSTFLAGSSSPGWACVPDATAGSTCTLAVAGTVPGGQSLPPGTSVNFAVRIDEPLAAGVDEITNQVRIADDGANGPDPDPTNNEDDDVRPIDAAPDLNIVKTADRNTISPGMTVVFTLTYSNVGGQDATGVEITETVPAGTTFDAAGSTAGWSCADGAVAGTTCLFTVGALAADGVSHTVEFAVVVSGAGGVVNTVSIEDDGLNGPDPTPPDNTSTLSIGGQPLWVPVNGPWALLLLLFAIGGLAWRRRYRVG